MNRQCHHPIDRYDHSVWPLGIRALIEAMEHPPAFQLLLDRGVLERSNDKGYPDKSLIGLSSRLIRAGKVEMIEILSPRGVPLDSPRLIEDAAETGIHMLKYLDHPHINPDDEGIKYALAKAAGRGDSAVVQYFLDKGCDPNARDRHTSYLDIAAEAKDPDAAIATLDILLCYGTDVNQLSRDYDHQHDDLYPDERRSYPDLIERERRIIQFLIARGSNPDPEHRQWARMTVSVAVNLERTEIIRCMLDAGSKVSDTSHCTHAGYGDSVPFSDISLPRAFPCTYPVYLYGEL